MLRWLVDAQAVPWLMWGMVGLSAVLTAAALFLVLVRLLPSAAPGEHWARELAELCAEIAPMGGILGTVSGLALGFGVVGQADAHALLVASLQTALYSTGFGLVLAMNALTILFLTARSRE